MSTIGNLRVEAFAEDVFELDAREFPQPWSLSQWESLDYSQHQLYTWRSPEMELWSFALFGLAQGDNVAHLYKIITLQHLRGTLISKDFFDELIKDLGQKGVSAIYLEVEVSNKRAIGFYKKMGFKVLRLSKGFYSNGEDAFIMSMTL